MKFSVSSDGWQYVVGMPAPSTPPSLEGIHHVALNVRDLDESERFYVDVMGFHVVPTRPDFGFAGMWLQAGAQQVHLLVDPSATSHPFQHFALRVADLEAWDTHLTAHAAQFRHSRYFPGAGRQIFITDPSGNQIELNQPD
jgi:glyoxylase I family protein